MNPLIYFILNALLAGGISWGISAGLRIGHLLCFGVTVAALIALVVLWTQAPEVNSSMDLLNNAFGKALGLFSAIFTGLGLIGGWKAGKNFP